MRSKQSNNRGELTAVQITLAQTIINHQITIYTDSQYAHDVVLQLTQSRTLNHRNLRENRDIICNIQQLILCRLNSGLSTVVRHVNSHLLDKGAKHRVKNWSTKMTRMKSVFGDQWERILKGNQTVDKLAELSLMISQVPGFITNSIQAKYVMRYQGIIHECCQSLSESFKAKKLKEYKNAYKDLPLWQLENKEVDWNATRKVYQSLNYNCHISQHSNACLTSGKLA